MARIDTNSINAILKNLASPPTTRDIRFPIVFRREYDVSFFGCECYHPFDTRKWGKVACIVKTSLDEMQGLKIRYIQPNKPISDEQLRLVHTEDFMERLKSRHNIVNTSEVPLLYLLPIRSINRYLLEPLRYQTLGTLIGVFVALKHQTAVNLGGGFHHCSSRKSGGFCFFADITLAIRNLWNFGLNQQNPNPILYKILIVDCDAHQGNGYARDVLLMSKKEKKHIYILDLYNPRIYPRDDAAKTIITREVLLKPGIEDEDYLQLLDYHLKAVIEYDRFQPDFIIYNAGTDIIKGDRLGRLNVSSEGIIKRDELVFRFAHANSIPILMLLSGGYQRDNAGVIARSLLNLINLRLIQPC